VGKTTLLKMMFHQIDDTLWLNADESPVRDRLSKQSVENLKGVVGKYKWVVIDEIQRIANAGLLLKILADHFQNTQFFVTGSSALDIADNIFEPLTGRHLLFHLHPLMMGEMYPKLSSFEIEQKCNFHLVHGCYPDVYNHTDDAAVLLKNLASQYLYKDVLAWKDIRKPQLLEKLLQLLAHQAGSQVSYAELAGQLHIKSETVESYIDLLEKSFVVFRLSAMSNNPRKEVSKMSKIFFWDNGIRNAVIENFNDISNRNDIGILWENFVVSERKKWLAWNRPHIKSYFWRNYNQSEVDYVEQDGKIIHAYEIKWNSQKKHNVSRAFMNAYPEATGQIITPRNISDFLHGDL
jgi:predicted AAA+ superfamily ATPase